MIPSVFVNGISQIEVGPELECQDCFKLFFFLFFFLYIAVRSKDPSSGWEDLKDLHWHPVLHL